MITGVVSANLEPTIPLVVHDVTGQSHPLEAVIDTSFDGFLALPSALITSLGLPWLCSLQGLLADGTVHNFDAYVATITWDGQGRTVEAEAVNAQPLVGMSMLVGHELRMRVVVGGTVTIEALP
jgi:clan AA aspartic protease